MKKAILVVLLLALLTLLLSGCASPEERAWNSGQKALAKEKYGDAVTAFEKAGSFQDAETLLQYATAFRNLENGVYADAAAGFQALGDFKDSQLMNIYCLAREQESLAQAAIAEGDADTAAGAMQEALAGYSRLSQFRDSDTRATECRELLYNKANEWLMIERYDAAAAGFAVLDGWQDSAQRQKYCEAAILEEQSSFVEAAAIYDGIPGVLDASARAEEARSQAYQMAADLKENGDYIAAANAFAALGSYRDAEEQRVSTCVQQVRSLLRSGSYTQALKELGIEVYDCDDAAKRLMAIDEDVKRKLTEVVGEDTYIEGVLNKNAVAKFLLTSEQNKRQVNSIVHPAVAKDFLESGMTWMESAILFDCGFQKYVDRVVCVTAPIETRIRRVMRRDGIDRKRTKEWIAKQMDQEEVRKLADFEIINDGRHALKKQIKAILKALNQTQ